MTDLADVDDYPAKLGRWWSGEARTALVMHTADRDEHLFTVPHVNRPFNQSLQDFDAEYDKWITNFRAANLCAVNFGYILIWKGGPELTAMRTINNPAQPIHSSVSRWFEQRQLLADLPNTACRLATHPELRFTESRRADGTLERVDISVPDDPFYTTYTVPHHVAEALRAIHAGRPRLKDRWNAQDGEWLDDLLQKSILYGVSDDAIAPASVQRTEHESILEAPTKTTPTCLSSYLR